MVIISVVWIIIILIVNFVFSSLVTIGTTDICYGLILYFVVA